MAGIRARSLHGRDAPPRFSLTGDEGNMSPARFAFPRLLAALTLGFATVAAAAVPDGRDPAPADRTEHVLLRPGEGIERTLAGGRVLRSRRFDPREPVRVLVQLDAEPVVAARLHAPAAGAADAVPQPRLRLEQLRADLAGLSNLRAGGPDAAAPRAEITREYTQVFSGAAVTLDPALLARVHALPYVRAVLPDDSVRACDEGSNQRIGADRVRNELGGTGAGVRVGIFDTGINYDHEAFGGGFGPGFRVAGGWDFVDDDDDPRDDDGHGTHVAGIVAGNGGGVTGVAPEATLYAFKVLNSAGTGLISTILAGLERALDPDGDPYTNDALQVLNCSFGAVYDTPNDPMAQALDYLSQAGVVCVAAAGDYGDWFGITSPGTSRRAITVGASTADDELAATSSRGPVRANLDLKPDLLAPGENIVSAALDGGTIEMSGTSMAAPQVAGVAAQLRQLHPNWSVDDIRSALIGCARDLQRRAFEQGAGRVQAYEAATATFSVTPPHLAFGRIADVLPVWTGTGTLRVKNLTAQPRTIRFPDTLALAPGAMVTLATDSVRLAAGASTNVIVHLSVDNAVTPFPPGRPFGYDGVLEMTSGPEVHRVPLSFHKAATLRVHQAVADDTHTLQEVLVFQPRPGGFTTFMSDRSQNLAELVAPGTYDFVATWYPFNTLEVREDVSVSGDVDMEFDGRNATNTLSFANVDEKGSPAACNRASFALIHTATGSGYDFLGFPFDVLNLSGFSDAFHLEWTRTQTNDRDRRLTFSGALAGLSSPQVISNLPGDLRHLAMTLPAPPVPSVVPFIWEYTSLGAGPAYLAIGWWNGGPPPVTGPCTFDWWLVPSPDVERVNAGFALDWYAWEGGALNITRQAIHGARLRLDRGWPFEGYARSFAQAPIFRFDGEHMRLGSGPPVWRGMFQNSAVAVALTGDRWPGFLDRHLVTDAYGTQFLEPDRPYTLSQDGLTIVSDTLRGAGDFTHFDTFSQAVAPGAWVFHTDRPWSLGGQPAQLDVTAAMDTRRSDPDPPSLRSLQVFSDGGVVDTVAFATARDAGVRFRLAEGDTAGPLGLFVRPSGGQAWTPLDVERDGDEFLARLPPTLSGFQDLRLEATDVSLNSLALEWTPAFFARPTVPVVFGGASVTFEGNGARVSWRIEHGADLRIGLERREDSGAWMEFGSQVADAEGVVSWADTTVRAAHTYRYRAVLANGGTPAYSSELSITFPSGPALTLAGARPNPVSAPELLVDFSLPSAARARLGLFDVSGRRIVEREVGALGPGPHSVVIAVPSSQRAGVYFLRLTQGSWTLTRRVCLLR
jgi:subtilisin family serine protease